MRFALPVALALAVAGCATPAPVPVVRPGEPLDEAAWARARDDRVWRAAMSCRSSDSGIELEVIGPGGALHYTYREKADLDAFQTCFHARVEALLLGAPGRLADQVPASTTVALESHGRSLLVDLLVDGVPARMLLDTGASKTTVKPALAARAGLVVRTEDLPVRLVVADGRTILVPLARTRLLALGEAGVADLDVGVYDVIPEEPAIDGLLGEDYLRFFSVRLDRQGRRLVLEAAR